MITQKERAVSLNEAIKIYNGIHDKLSPYCIKMSVGGSVRRERNPVSDIEIVCIPKLIEESADLFGNDHPRVEGFINTINKWKKVKGDPVNGKYTQRMHTTGVKLDIFIVCAENWGMQFMLRTGPFEYSKRMLDSALKNVGCYSEGGFVRDIKQQKIIPILEEEDFYKLVQEPYILPPYRIK